MNNEYSVKRSYYQQKYPFVVNQLITTAQYSLFIVNYSLLKLCLSEYY